MGALIDSMTGGGYDGSADGGVGDSSGAIIASNSDAGGYLSGALQTLSTLGSGYLSRRLDIDLQKRYYSTMPMPNLPSTQNGLGGYGQVVRGPNGQQLATLNLSAIMPLILVGVAVFMFAKKG
ncbi:MAG: hypothetical protein ACK4S6_16245 [Roseateles asaccharophilus]|uniref:hypothetical protein n=1 Tax=Roseateles asaccharophilus TaxID=582607 RepID=UPI00391B1265